MEVSSAYILSRPPGGKPNPVMAGNILKSFALREADDKVDRNPAWVRQSGWRQEFKEIFGQAVAWSRTIRQQSPEELYRLSRRLRARPDAERAGHTMVANGLLGLIDVTHEVPVDKVTASTSPLYPLVRQAKTDSGPGIGIGEKSSSI